MKNRVAVLFLLIIGVSCAYYFFVREKDDIDYTSEENISSINAVELPLISVKNQSIDNTEINTKIVKNIPEVKILSNQASSEKANNYISRFIDDEETNFQKDVGEDLLKSNQGQNITNSFSLNSKVISATPRLFNIRFDENTVLVHGGKPSNKIRYILFDIENGKTLLFSDIITDESIFQKISEYASSTQKDVEIINKSIKENHTFSLEKDGLKIVFDIIDDNSINSEIVSIPLNIISEYIKQDILNEITSEKEFIRMSEPE